MLNGLERFRVHVAAYIVTSSREQWLDQSGGDAGFIRSGNFGVRSREARVIALELTCVGNAYGASEGRGWSWQ